MKDYYKILEVNKDASPEIIAKVYKILAKKYHPDLQDDNIKKELYEEKFKEISEAYEILSNEEKRKEYDSQLNLTEEQNSVSLGDYNALRNYCVQLENELNQYRNIYNQYNQNSYSPSQNYSNSNNINRNVKPKKSFKEIWKDIVSIGMTVIIIYILLKLLWDPIFLQIL